MISTLQINVVVTISTLQINVVAVISTLQINLYPPYKSICCVGGMSAQFDQDMFPLLWVH